MNAPLDGRTPKYHITKANGEPVDPDAQYLTLRMDNKARDAPEWVALRAYLDALGQCGQHDLKRHLMSFFGTAPDTVPDGLTGGGR